jgi:uncharacterized protein
MKIITLFALAALVAPLSRAEDSLPLASQLLDLNSTATVMQQTFEAGLKPSLDHMRAQGAPADLVESIHVEARNFFAENFKWDVMKPQIAKIYADAFTAAELQDMIAFYKSPTGQKTVEKLPGVTQQIMALALSGVQAHMPEFQQRVGALIQDYKKKADAAAALAAPASQAAPAASDAPGTITVPPPASK